MRKAREEISLKELGFENTRIRKAVNGGYLVEIMGPECTSMAESLADKLKSVLGKKAVVARPTIKGELRLIGLTDSTTMEEVRCVLADIGCNPEEVKTGPIREMSNGLGAIWAKCPFTAALKVTSLNKIRIGWTVARVEPLRVRPLQCYKCWKYGHVRNGCKSDKDRSNACNKCGSEGHSARDCSARPFCAVYTEKDRNGQHRLGSTACTAVNYRMRQPQPGRRTTVNHRS